MSLAVSTNSVQTERPARKLSTTPWGCLPARMRVLFVSGRQRSGEWLAESIATDSASEVLLEKSTGMAAGLARLRNEVFDAVLLSHEVEGFDALELLDAVRAGSSDEQPVIVLGQQSEQEMTAVCLESGADAYVCASTATVRSLLWVIARAMERHRLLRDNRHLQNSQRHHLEADGNEAIRLLQQQRKMLHQLDADQLDETPGIDLAGGNSESTLESTPTLPRQLVEHYQELLRAYVIMGSGNLAPEMSQLAEVLAASKVSARQAMLLHLSVLEEMVVSLGNRSARHVMNRADMLVLELMGKLAERYRGQYLLQIHPPHQQWLPGFLGAG